MTSAVEVLYIMSPITHMLSLYYHIIFYNFHYLTIYLYAHGDLGTPEVTSFFPNVVMHVRLKHLAISGLEKSRGDKTLELCRILLCWGRMEAFSGGR